MGLKLGEIASALGGSLEGEPEHRVSRVSAVNEAGTGDICVVWDRASLGEIESSSAAAFVTSAELQLRGRNVIRVSDPRQAMIDLVELLHPKTEPPAAIEDGAFVAKEATCADDVYVAAGARVEAGAVLASRVQIHANAVVGAEVTVGEASVLHPGVVVYPGARIGARVVIHSGAVIGADGFSYRRTDDGRYHKIPHVGIVEIEDDVEIGACTTIDRAVLGKTVIRRGTKIDNLVQIAHNVEIGQDCVVVGQAGIAGSTRIGGSSEIGAQAGVSDHLSIGSGARIGARTGVSDDIEGSDWLGSPALPAAHARRVFAIINRLPELNDEIRSLRRRCEAMEREINTLRSSSD